MAIHKKITAEILSLMLIGVMLVTPGSAQIGLPIEPTEPTPGPDEILVYVETSDGEPAMDALARLIEVGENESLLDMDTTDEDGYVFLDAVNMTEDFAYAHIVHNATWAEAQEEDVQAGQTYELVLEPFREAEESEQEPISVPEPPIAEEPSVDVNIPDLPLGVVERGGLDEETILELQEYMPERLEALSVFDEEENDDPFTEPDAPDLPEGMPDVGEEAEEHEIQNYEEAEQVKAESEEALITIITPTIEFPWVVNVPVSVDLTGDLIFDSIVMVTGAGDGEICLTIFVLLEASSPRMIGIHHPSTDVTVVLNAERLPGETDFCGESLDDGGRVGYTADASRSGSAWSVDVAAPLWDVVLQLSFSTFPSHLEGSASKRNSGVDFDYEASGRAGLQMEMTAPVNVKADIDRLPSSFSGSFYDTSSGNTQEFHFDYFAANTIWEIGVEYSGSGVSVVAELTDLPSQLDGTLKIVESTSFGVSEATYDQDATNNHMIREIDVDVVVSGTPISFRTEDVPPNLRLSYDIAEDGDTRTIDASYRGWKRTGVREGMDEINLQIGNTNDFNWLRIYVPEFPEELSFSLKTAGDGNRFNEMRYEHEAWSSTPRIHARGSFGNDLNLMADVKDIPADATLHLKLREFSIAKVLPDVSYSASDGGLTIMAEVDGLIMGNGDVSGQIRNIPREFHITPSKGGLNDILVLDVTTKGTGVLDRLAIDALVPSVSHKRIEVHAIDLEHMTFAPKWSCVFTCVYLDARDSQAMWLVHPRFSIGDSVNWSPNMTWCIQQRTFLVWDTKYCAADPNIILWLEDGPGIKPSRATRAVWF